MRNHSMPTPYGLKIIETALACPPGFVTGLSPDVRKALDAISLASFQPREATLYVEGQPVRGVFLICSGRVKLSASSADGKVMILRIAEAGELIGLPATISGEPYEVTAETIEPAQTNFIRRDSFLKFLQDHGDAAFSVAKLLTKIYFTAYYEIRSLGLSRTVTQRIARFILDWSEQHSGDRDRLQMGLTQEEIAELIGVSRETVTRVFTRLKESQLISLKGSTLEILKRAALEELARM